MAVETTSARVQCPVCCVELATGSINAHLDQCLLQTEVNGILKISDPKQEEHAMVNKKRRLGSSDSTPGTGEVSRLFSTGNSLEESNEQSIQADFQPVVTNSLFSMFQKPKTALCSVTSSTESGSESPRSAIASGSRTYTGEGPRRFTPKEVGASPSQKPQAAASAVASFGPGLQGPHPKQQQQRHHSVTEKLRGKPLADKMRPTTFQEYIGQAKVVGENTMLRTLLESQEVPSLILWGPPGCGKTTLAHIIANNCKKSSTRFVTLSATSASTNDVREIIKQAQNEQRLTKRKTIIFIDEIHRFNKLQQDTFLPHVECGTITLIGATTENPSFQVNAALLSRCRVIVLEKLPADEMEIILKRAIVSLGIHIEDEEDDCESLNVCGYSEPPVYIEKNAVNTVAQLCDGDARTGLNALQLAIQARLAAEHVPLCQNKQGGTPQKIVITEEHVKEGLQRSHILYDRAGDEHYNCISALHKSMRGSDENASLYWLARMLEGGEDPLYVARRLVRFASEDVGLADPQALTQAVAAYQGCHLIGMPECEVLLAQCAVYLARAPKSIEVYAAYNNAKACVRSHKGPLPSVPLHLRNAPTKLMKNLGYGRDYKYNPKFKEPVEQDYLPEELKGINFFR
ncbi:ATPase WRNIP1 [Protopterus annectens]|uniref:ATPase WRNIP1 n=1 Tax=Protopterus annectens TaxID=7888 RepID=UPI001CFA5926|nr:ATPase WRNIP1 [Protopterus annectens]